MGFARLPSDNVAFERVDLIKELGDKKKNRKKTTGKTNLKAALI